jgi:hypothetical protein
MVAHLLHSLKSHAAVLAFIEPALVRKLLVVHKLFHLAKLFAAFLAGVAL